MDFMYKQVIVVRTDLKMGTGKIAAQTAHASISAMEKAMRDNGDIVEKWKEEGMAKIVVKVESEKELLELFEMLKKKFPVALIKDAGHTQVKENTATCIGIGPVDAKEIDKYTGKLKLL